MKHIFREAFRVRPHPLHGHARAGQNLFQQFETLSAQVRRSMSRKLCKFS